MSLSESEMNGSGRVLFAFVPQSDSDFERLRATLLSNNGAESVEIDLSGDSGFAAEFITAIVILGGFGLAAITRLADWLRDRNDCLLVVDARGPDLKIEERCDIAGRRGQVIVVTSPNEQVVIHRNQPPLDLEELVKNAIGKSPAAVADFAVSVGATAEIESPRSVL